METSFITAAITAFGAGIAASVTPCVYPLIPVTLAIFGATRDVSRPRALSLSVSYVLGMATMYMALGVISALSGSILGTALRNPWIVTGTAGLLILLSLYTLDIVRLEAVYKLQAKAGSIGGRGLIGALLMGSVSGVVAAPCTAPILITILGVAASTQSASLGALLLFIYAIGFGLIFILLGTFSGLVHKLPRSGDWLHMVKFAISASILVVAFLLLKPLLSIATEPVMSVSGVLLYLSLAVITVLMATIGYRRNLKTVKFACAAILAMSVLQLAISGGGTRLNWLRTPELAIKASSKTGTPVMIDFYAEWCAACKEYESITFKDMQVEDQLKNMSISRVDLTIADQETDKIHQRYSLAGLPTIVFLCPSGLEVPESRIQGFKGPQDFLTHLSLVRANIAEFCPKN